MKKKLKAFTLIELIVAIAVFGILMAGIVKMVEPLSNTTAEASVMNNQRNVENAICTYIGENLRYASNLVIVEGGTVENAVKKFIDMAPADYSGNEIDYSVNSNQNRIRVIAFDGKNTYSYKNNNFTGRIISSKEGRNAALNFDPSSLSPSDNSKPQYLVFGSDYYTQGNYYLDARICDGSLCLTVDSDYYYTANTNGKFSRTASAPTKGTYELRCMTDDNDSFVFACIKSTDTINDTLDTSHPASTSRGPDGDNVIYFVYTYGTNDKSDADWVSAKSPAVVGSGTPGKGDANCPKLS